MRKATEKRDADRCVSTELPEVREDGQSIGTHVIAKHADEVNRFGGECRDVGEKKTDTTCAVVLRRRAGTIKTARPVAAHTAEG